MDNNSSHTFIFIEKSSLSDKNEYSLLSKIEFEINENQDQEASDEKSFISEIDNFCGLYNSINQKNASNDFAVLDEKVICFQSHGFLDDNSIHDSQNQNNYKKDFFDIHTLTKEIIPSFALDNDMGNESKSQENDKEVIGGSNFELIISNEEVNFFDLSSRMILARGPERDLNANLTFAVNEELRQTRIIGKKTKRYNERYNTIVSKDNQLS